MQALRKYKNKNTGFESVFLLLSILLVFSSCDTRKAIQSEFNLPVSKTLNPIKSATVNSTHCASYNEETAFQNNNSTQQSKIFVLKNMFSISATIFAKTIPGYPQPANETSVSPIPIYILYQQLKAFI